MPPKIKITKEDIIKTATQLVRESGDSAINARAVATALNCSTQPIFCNFESMDELRDAVVLNAYNIYTDFIKNEVGSGKYPPYKAFGMAYVRFAKEEKELFKVLFMRARTEKSFVPTSDFDESVEMIMKANGVSRESAELIHLEMWTCVHGIGTILATSFLELDFELISNMLTDVYQGIRMKHLAEES